MSGQLTVQFFGICTHFRESGLMPVPHPWTHRVVLVNASEPERLGHGLAGHIDPHVARLQIRTVDLRGPLEARPWFPISYSDGEKLEWKLEGVSLKIIDELPPWSGPVPPPTCIPSLQACTWDAISAPGGFVTDSIPSEVSCYFDFDKPILIESGRLDETRAAIALITAGSGDPGIKVTPFDESEPPVFLYVNPGSPITISNIPVDPRKEKPDDFQLHYLTLQTFPGRFRPVDTSMCQVLYPSNPPRNISDFSTPECSNSNYP